MSHGDDLPSVPVYRAGPAWMVAARRLWRAATVLACLAALGIAFAHSYQVAPDAALPPAGVRVLAIFAVAVVLWVTEAVPLVVTGLGVFVALVAAAVDPTLAKPLWNVQTVSGWFGDRVVFFLLGIFLMAGALTASHVVDHAALRLLGVVGGSPRRLRQGVFWAAFVGSWFMAEHAVAAMLFPLCARIRDALGRPRQSSTYIGGLFLALAWGATIGGITTYLGGARIALAMGIAAQKGVAVPGFFDLIAHSLPIAIPMGIVGAIIIEIAFPVDIPTIAPARAALEERRRELGRFGPRQRVVTAILAATIIAWALLGVGYLAPVALGSAALLIGTGLVAWREVERHVPWDLLLMEAGALALCAGLERTGAAAWAATLAFASIGHEPILVIAVVASAAVLLTEFFSNPAVVTLMVPLLVVAAPQLGFQGNEIALVLAVALPCGLSFVLPLGSPPLAIAFSSGEYRVAKSAAWGLLMDVLSILATVAAYALFWR